MVGLDLFHRLLTLFLIFRHLSSWCGRGHHSLNQDLVFSGAGSSFSGRQNCKDLEVERTKALSGVRDIFEFRVKHTNLIARGFIRCITCASVTPKTDNDIGFGILES